MMTNTFLNMPYALVHDEGKRIYSFGKLLTVVKASSEQTGGAFNLFDAVCPPGFATPIPGVVLIVHNTLCGRRQIAK